MNRKNTTVPIYIQYSNVIRHQELPHLLQSPERESLTRNTMRLSGGEGLGARSRKYALEAAACLYVGIFPTFYKGRKSR